MSVCSSIDRYTWSELEEELDLLPPPPEWLLAPAAALPLPPPPALSAVAPARAVIWKSANLLYIVKCTSMALHVT